MSPKRYSTSRMACRVGHGNIGAVAREAAANGTRGIAAHAPERGGGHPWLTRRTTRRSGGTVTPCYWGAEVAVFAGGVRGPRLHWRLTKNRSMLLSCCFEFVLLAVVLNRARFCP